MLLLLLGACHDPKPSDDAPVDTTDSTETGDSEDSVPVGPALPTAFDRFCGERTWTETLSPLSLPESSGSYQGFLADHTEWKKGTVEQSKIIPAHPFWVQSVRVQFADGTGDARVRLMTTFGRSYPGGYPELDTEGVNVMPPVDLEVAATGDRNDWTVIDVAELGVFLEPTQHYVIVNEYIDRGGPTVGIETVPSGETSRALLILADEDTPYGLDGNFRMELDGQAFCTWDEAARWFEDRHPVFETEVSGLVAVADVDGDGHEDVLTYEGGPTAWKGDGAGGFSAWPDLWPEVQYATWMLFGDVDNDGDADAFAASYIGVDNDGDGIGLGEGDCNDADAAVNPGEKEEVNGRDDDCDGVADDGTGTADTDADGVDIASGDCDDTRPDVGPGFPELKDSIDNDCDGSGDEDFPSRMLLNDGTGHFSAVPGAGLEITEPTTAGGFGDANEDGFLDLYVGNWLRHYPDDPAVQGHYWEGNGDGTYTDALAAAGLELPTPWSCYGMEWTDYNNDGHADLFVGNYHLYDNQLWENQGDGTFVDVAVDKGVAHDEEPSPYPQYPGGHTYGGDFGDIDNDGDLDFYMANLAHPRTQPWGDPSMFVINQGAPDYTFENRREEYGLVYDEGDINAQFADFDNDMDLDLAIASLYPQHYARVYRNEGGTAFTDVTYEIGMNAEHAVSVVWADVDEDGDDDLIVADGLAPAYVHLYQNRVGQDNHWVDFVLRGTATNRDGAGARVTVVAGGVTQLRDIQDGNGSFNTQRPRVAHFGLAEVTTIDSVTVRWIGGATETFTGVGADGRWLLVEGSGVAQAVSR